MATTSDTYAAHRKAGLCGFCTTPSVPSRCDRCYAIQRGRERDHAYDTRALPGQRQQYRFAMQPLSDRRQGGALARALGWALSMHQV